MSVTKRNFYQKATGQRKVLKQTIRPTYKSVDFPADSVFGAENNSPDRPAEIDLEALKKSLYPSEPEEIVPAPITTPPPTEVVESKPVVAESSQPSQESQGFQSSVETQSQPPASQGIESEISEISNMIKQATQKLQELEEKKKQQQEAEAEAAKAEHVEEFNGVDSDQEEYELIKQQLAHSQRLNKKLKKEIEELKESFEKEKKSLEKSVRQLKTEMNQDEAIDNNKFFNFSKELQDAVKAIETLNDPNFKPEVSQVVIKADELPETQDTTLTQVEAKPIELNVPKKIQIDGPTETKASQPTNPELSPGVEQLKQEIQQKVDNVKSKDAKPTKGKKLLMTGVGALVLMLSGGLVTFRLLAKPKVNEKLVDEYMQQANQSQVLGIESQSHVPDGIVADKNSDASLDDTQWAEFESRVFGIRVQYPANVTERLHSANSITFLRKNSYLFKVTKYNTNQDIDEYWDSTKDKGVKYSAEETEFDHLPALYLKVEEDIDYPGDRYLVKYNGNIYDIWFAVDESKYGAEDIERATQMLESFMFI